MYIICYRKPDGTPCFEETQDVTEWMQANPSARIEYTFNKKSCIANNEGLFRCYAQRYGLLPDDYNAVYRNTDGTPYQIIGLNPKNRKYNIIVSNMETGEVYKTTPKHVVNRLIETRRNNM